MRTEPWAQELLTKNEWWTRLVANLHPLLLMIPLGLILVIVLVEVFGWLSFGKWRPITVLTLFMVVLFGSLAAISGLAMMEVDGNTGPNWITYMWFGIGALGAFALAFLCKVWGTLGNGRGFFYAIFLLGGLGALGYGAATVGQKVHNYNVVPAAEGEKVTPFGNQLEMQRVSAEYADLQVVADKTQQDLSTKTQELTVVTAEKTTLAGKLTAEQQKLQAAQNTAKQLEKTAADAQAKAKATEQKLVQMQKQLAEAQKAIMDKDKSAAEMKSSLEKAQKDLQAAQKAASEASNKAKTQEEGNKKLQSELEKLKKEMEKEPEAKKEEAEAESE